MSASETLDNLLLYGKHSKLFISGSSEIIASSVDSRQTIVTFLLVLIAFVSLSLALLNRNAPAKYFSSAAVASLSVALGSVYVANFFGVYV